jgi:hypothetical protein
MKYCNNPVERGQVSIHNHSWLLKNGVWGMGGLVRSPPIPQISFIQSMAFDFKKAIHNHAMME